jgi:hypothetical protein
MIQQRKTSSSEPKMSRFFTLLLLFSPLECAAGFGAGSSVSRAPSDIPPSVESSLSGGCGGLR